MNLILYKRRFLIIASVSFILALIAVVSVLPIKSVADDNPTLGSTTTRPMSYSRGSNYWTTSNLREWLNSNVSDVNYTSNSPSYRNEPGFLTGFTKDEQNAIAVTQRRSFVNGTDGEIARDGGSRGMPWHDGYQPNYFIQIVLDNINNVWKDVFYQTVNDKVFVLQTNELYEYVQKRGMSYKKELTDDARNKFNISSQYYTYGSTAVRSDEWAELIAAVDSSGRCTTLAPYNKIGVAPAVYIKPSYTFSNGVKASDLKIGDNINFGKYDGYDINWTVINKTPDGYPLLWSTKILTVKEFDAPGDATYRNSNSVNFPSYDLSIKDDLKYTNGSTDTSEPVISVVNTDDLNTMKNSSWKLTVKATDTGSGISKMILPDGSTVNSDQATYSIDSNGMYDFVAVDKAGNYYGTTIPVGNINPPASVQISSSSNGWTNKDVTVNIKASNTDVGWSLDDGILNATSSSSLSSKYWSNYATYAGKRISVQGTVKLVEAKKDVGNLYTAFHIVFDRRYKMGNDYIVGTSYITCPGTSVYLKDLLDMKPHTVSGVYTVDGNYFSNLFVRPIISGPPQNNGSFTVEWSNVKVDLLDKEDFGIEKIILPSGDEINASSYTDTLSKEGTYEYKVVDSRGMVTTKSVTVKIDKNPPKLNITGNPTEDVHKSIILHVTASDDQSGVSQIQKPNGEWVSATSLDYKVSDNGSYKFVVRDNAGNETTQTVNVTRIGSKFNLYKTADNTKFSSVNLKDGKQTVYSKGVDLQVEDNRETGTGWNVMVSATPFSNGKGSKYPSGSLILSKPSSVDNGVSIKNGSWIIDDGNAVSVVSAGISKGDGLTNIKFGDPSSLKLTVPFSSYSGSYTSVVTYSLVSGP